ncbi:MAG: hypothetical protein M3Z14_06920, partial [Candidatus Eremiobacteraeota bacterium]|nr:hypothetical protein [Candidatus Eremiobacteraeota bacterium]
MSSKKRLRNHLRQYFKSIACATVLALVTLGATPRAASQTAYPSPVRVPSHHPFGIVAGPDEAFWFTEISSNKIGRISYSGIITEFEVPTPDARPFRIVVGSDAALWFTEARGNKIGRLTTDGKFSEYPIPTPACEPSGIAVTPDGSIWFAETAGNKIGHRSANGTIVEFSLPSKNARPLGIASASNGRVVFSEARADKIGLIDANGNIIERSILDGASPSTKLLIGTKEPESVAQSNDGSIWFNERLHNRLGQLDAAGRLHEYVLRPEKCALRLGCTLTEGSADPTDVAIGPNGSVFATEFVGNAVDRFDLPNHRLQHFSAPTYVCRPASIRGRTTPRCIAEPGALAFAPDGTVWLTEFNASAVAKMTPTGQFTEFTLPDSMMLAHHRVPRANDPFAQRALSSHVKHVVYIVQENHSFDVLFNGFPGANTVDRGKLIDVTVPLRPDSLRERWDMGHEHESFISAYDGGKMDGFYREGFHGIPNHPYAFVPRTETDVYWKLAEQYALSDNTFEPVTGPSYAAHQYLIAGDSGGVAVNPDNWGCDASPIITVPILVATGAQVPGPYPCFNYPTLADTAAQQGVDWKYYFPIDPLGAVQEWSAFFAIRSVETGDDYRTHVVI